MADKLHNTGKDNTGEYNSGDSNSGYKNSGYRNSGNRNSGDWNSGNWNSGDWNSGNWNSGNRNSGDFNSGDFNSGNWNSGNWNSGYLNTNEPLVRIFNKETTVKREDIRFPDFFYNVDINIWVEESEMSDEEKKAQPQYRITGGYLKTVDYKEAWAIAWKGATEEDKKLLFALPNFDAEIFKEITGIDVTEVDENTKKKEAILKKIEELKAEADKL